MPSTTTIIYVSTYFYLSGGVYCAESVLARQANSRLRPSPPDEGRDSADSFGWQNQGNYQKPLGELPAYRSSSTENLAITSESRGTAGVGDTSARDVSADIVPGKRWTEPCGHDSRRKACPKDFVTRRALGFMPRRPSLNQLHPEALDRVSRATPDIPVPAGSSSGISLVEADECRRAKTNSKQLVMLPMHVLPSLRPGQHTWVAAGASNGSGGETPDRPPVTAGRYGSLAEGSEGGGSGAGIVGSPYLDGPDRIIARIVPIARGAASASASASGITGMTRWGGRPVSAGRQGRGGPLRVADESPSIVRQSKSMQLYHVLHRRSPLLPIYRKFSVTGSVRVARPSGDPFAGLQGAMRERVSPPVEAHISAKYDAQSGHLDHAAPYVGYGFRAPGYTYRPSLGTRRSSQLSSYSSSSFVEDGADVMSAREMEGIVLFARRVEREEMASIGANGFVPENTVRTISLAGGRSGDLGSVVWNQFEHSP